MSDDPTRKMSSPEEDDWETVSSGSIFCPPTLAWHTR